MWEMNEKCPTTFPGGPRYSTHNKSNCFVPAKQLLCKIVIFLFSACLMCVDEFSLYTFECELACPEIAIWPMNIKIFITSYSHYCIPSLKWGYAEKHVWMHNMLHAEADGQQKTTAVMLVSWELDVEPAIHMDQNWIIKIGLHWWVSFCPVTSCW